MRKLKTRRKPKRKIRVRHPNASRRAAAPRVRIRRSKRAQSLPKDTRNLRTKPRKARRIVVRRRRSSASSRSFAKRIERLKREINVFGAEGYQPVAKASSRQSKLSSRHLIEISRFLRTGDTGPLKKFRGKRIAGIELLTDPKRIREFADADLVKLDGLYRDQRGHGRRR